MREPRKSKVDRCSIERANHQQRERGWHYVNRAATFEKDPNRAKRLEVSECKLCFGEARVGGATCTTALCAGCGKELHFNNTCVDVLCIDYVNRRKPRPMELAEVPDAE